MEQHIRTVAILNIVYAYLGIVAALFVLLFFGGMAGLVSDDQDPDAAAGVVALGAIGGIAFVTIMVMAVPTLIAGIGLLRYREWARILTMVMSALHLLSVPVGTALGIYGLWAQSRTETHALFKSRPAIP